MTFDYAVDLILKHEGGYVNDPKDPGGETNFGISKRSYPTLDIKNLTVAQAKEIYRKDYWDALQCDKLPPVLAICVFDSAVNQGAGYAAKTLQEALGVKADGVLGPVTIGTAAKLPHLTMHKFQAMRLRSYAANKNYSIYGMTWFRRTIETTAAAARAA